MDINPTSCAIPSPQANRDAGHDAKATLRDVNVRRRRTGIRNMSRGRLIGGNGGDSSLVQKPKHV